MNGSCSVHEWVGQFKSETVSFKMTSVCGHVMSFDFVGKYNSWDKVDPVSIFFFSEKINVNQFYDVSLNCNEN